MYDRTAVLDTNHRPLRWSFHQNPKESYMQIKSNNANFDRGPNIGAWSIVEIVYTVKAK